MKKQILGLLLALCMLLSLLPATALADGGTTGTTVEAKPIEVSILTGTSTSDYTMIEWKAGVGAVFYGQVINGKLEDVTSTVGPNPADDAWTVKLDNNTGGAAQLVLNGGTLARSSTGLRWDKIGDKSKPTGTDTFTQPTIHAYGQGALEIVILKDTTLTKGVMTDIAVVMTGGTTIRSVDNAKLTSEFAATTYGNSIVAITGNLTFKNANFKVDFQKGKSDYADHAIKTNADLIIDNSVIDIEFHHQHPSYPLDAVGMGVTGDLTIKNGSDVTVYHTSEYDWGKTGTYGIKVGGEFTVDASTLEVVNVLAEADDGTPGYNWDYLISNMPDTVNVTAQYKKSADGNLADLTAVYEKGVDMTGVTDYYGVYFAPKPACDHSTLEQTDCTQDVICSTCGEVAIPKKGTEHVYTNACDTDCNNAGCTAGNREPKHNYGDWINNGENHKQVCANACGIDNIAPHSFTYKGGAGTCVCGATTTCTHNYGAWVDGKQTCGTCGDTITCAHNGGVWVDGEKTCATCGKTITCAHNGGVWVDGEKTCATCGKTITCAHNYGEWFAGEKTCETCGDTITCDHNYSDWFFGEKTCETCGDTIACDHDYSEWFLGEMTCEICGDTIACEHDYGEWVGGVKTCGTCGTTTTCAHNYGEWVDSVKTCGTCGTTTTCAHNYGKWVAGVKTCGTCGDAVTCEHNYGQWVAGVKTCKTCGDTSECAHTNAPEQKNCEDAVICSDCGATALAAKEHTPGTAATCDADQICTVCNKVLTAKLGHTGGTATCKAKAVCSVCNKEYGELAACVPAVDDGDCATAIKCSVCDKELTAAKEHKFTDDKDTTCDNEGCKHTRVIENPATGDTFSVVLLATMALASLATLAVTVIGKKRAI